MTTPANTDASRVFADFLTNTRFEELPAGALAATKRSIFSTFEVMLADGGAAANALRIVRTLAHWGVLADRHRCRPRRTPANSPRRLRQLCDGHQYDFNDAHDAVEAGKLRTIGVTTKQRIPGFDDVPTIAEKGDKDYELSGWIAVGAPKGTSPQVVNRLNMFIADILREKGSVDFFSSGCHIMPTGREGVGEFQTRETAKWKSSCFFRNGSSVIKRKLPIKINEIE